MTYEPVRAPHGSALSCRGWPQEAALRMLMNNLDPEVAEHPEQLVVYGGAGRAARPPDAPPAVVRAVVPLGGGETLLAPSGQAPRGFPAHPPPPPGPHADSPPLPPSARLGER